MKNNQSIYQLSNKAMNKFRKSRIESIIEKLNSIKSDLENIQTDEQEAYENLPNSLQLSQKGYAMQENVDDIESAMLELDESIAFLDAITERN